MKLFALGEIGRTFGLFTVLLSSAIVRSKLTEDEEFHVHQARIADSFTVGGRAGHSRVHVMSI